MNLIINARDAMPQGGAIKVAARNEKAGGGQWLGLPAGDYVVLGARTAAPASPPSCWTVVEPFFTTKDVWKGTGLGLTWSMASPDSRAARCAIAERARPGHVRRTVASAIDGGSQLPTCYPSRRPNSPPAEH